MDTPQIVTLRVLVEEASELGAARALELFYTGRVVSGREAESMGLVNRAVPRAELMPVALETARAIAASAPLVVRMLKQAVYQGLASAVTAAVEYEAFCQAITFGSDDLREGLTAARERRAPRTRSHGSGATRSVPSRTAARRRRSPACRPPRCA